MITLGLIVLTTWSMANALTKTANKDLDKFVSIGKKDGVREKTNVDFSIT